MSTDNGVQVVHALPGRVRIKLRHLKNNPVYADEIQRHLLAISGLNRLEANPQTGSLLIEYNPNVLEVLTLHPSVAARLGVPPSNSNTPSSKGRPPGKRPVKIRNSEGPARAKRSGRAKSKKASR